MSRSALALAALLTARGAAAQQTIEPPVPALLEPTFLLSSARIVDPDSFRGEGSILGTTREMAIREQSLTAADQVFVPRPLRGRARVLGDVVQFYRIDRRIHDPRTGERLGRLLLPTGIGTVDSIAGEVARVRVTRALRPILIGDFARPVGEDDALVPATSSREAPVEGHVVALEEEKAIVPTFDRIFLRTAVRDALAPGEVVLVHRPAAVETGRRLPDVAVGRAMVIQVRGEIATAVLFEVYRSDLVPGDLFRRVPAGPWHGT